MNPIAESPLARKIFNSLGIDPKEAIRKAQEGEETLNYVKQQVNQNNSLLRFLVATTIDPEDIEEHAKTLKKELET